jgi:hypothetical protein
MESLELTYTLIGELKPCIGMAANRHESKQELMMSLFHLLRAYPCLASRETYGLWVAINNFIIMEAEKHCSIYLSDHELLAIWGPKDTWGSFIKH